MFIFILAAVVFALMAGWSVVEAAVPPEELDAAMSREQKLNGDNCSADQKSE